MDTVTQAALGATIAEAGFRHRLGGRAVVFGALCGLLPDADVVARVAGEWASLVYHRGASHSLLVLPLVAPLLGWLGARVFGMRERYWTWVHLAFWGLITHPLLDVCTSYGTQLFAPVSRARFALDNVAIIDPLYTGPLFVALVLAARRRGSRALSQRAAQVALVATGAYLGLGLVISRHAAQDARAQLAAAGFEVEALRTPTPMVFPVLRRVVARGADDSLRIGVWSLLSDGPVEFFSMPAPAGPAVEAALESPEGQVFVWFSDGFLSAREEAVPTGARVRLYDQRYGLFANPTWTPFAAEFRVDDAGRVTEARRMGRNRDLDVGAELEVGWSLVWGESRRGSARSSL